MRLSFLCNRADLSDSRQQRHNKQHTELFPLFPTEDFELLPDLDEIDMEYSIENANSLATSSSHGHSGSGTVTRPRRPPSRLRGMTSSAILSTTSSSTQSSYSEKLTVTSVAELALRPNDDAFRLEMPTPRPIVMAVRAAMARRSWMKRLDAIVLD